MLTRARRHHGSRLAKLAIVQTTLVLLVALVGVAFTEAAASATPAKAPAVQAQQVAAPADSAVASRTGDITPQASWFCNWRRVGNNVDSYCTVYSGYLRQWAYCAGWGYIYTPWVGPGNWHLWTYCNGYTLTAWGYQTVG